MWVMVIEPRWGVYFPLVLAMSTAMAMLIGTMLTTIITAWFPIYFLFLYVYKNKEPGSIVLFIRVCLKQRHL